MDVGGTTASATATPESTVLAEKSSITPKAVNETSSTSDKNGSIPDSSLDSMKDSTGVADSSKDVAKASMLPEKKTMDTIASNASESSSKGELQKIPVKLSSVSSGDPMMTNKDGEAKVLTSSDKGITAKSDHHKDELDHDDDDDDLLKRMEAIEKGEDIVIPVKYEQKKDDPTHQNGMLEKMPEKQIEVVPPKLKDAGKTGESVAKPSQSSSLTKVVAPVAESCLDKPVEAVNPNAKRKHSLNETESNEPEMKKAHVDDLTLEPKSSPPKTSSEKTSSPTKLSSESSAGPSVSKSNFVEKPLEKPPSVEKMEVDGSPESDVSSPKSVDTISNVEPNSQPGTTVEDKSEEISSSVVEETMRQESDCTESGKMDNSNVSSSDDKREGTSGKIKPVENEVSASVLPTPSEEEAMDVDEDGNDVAESSTPAATNAAAGSVPVEEPLCIKKVAYLCTDEEQRGEQKGDSKSMGATEKPCGSSLATSSTLTASAKTASTSEVTERMEVDSATKATSGTAGTTKPLIQCEEVVDSSNATVPTKKPVVERAEKSLGSISLSNVAAISEESFVESTQPSSSSDTKKQSAVENRMNDQAREVGLRAGLQTKPTSTPKNTSVSLVPSSINPSTLKTLNPLRTSAVSSSNVCSATSVQPNMAKVSSGSVNKATNPATSPVESRRSEVGDTTTMTTTTTSTVETASVAKKAGLLTTNAESSMSSKAETEALPLSTMSGATSASSVKSSPPKKESHREESKGNLNTADPSEVDSCTAAVSDTNTSEDVNVFLTNVRKLNGISSTSGGTEMDVKTDVANSHTSVKQEDDNVKASNSSEQLHLLGTVCGMASPEQQYEVTIWCEGQDLQFMSVKRIVDEKMVREPAATTSDGALHGVCKIDSSSKQTSTGPSSNGRSGNSIGPSKLSETHIASSGQPSENSSSSTLTVSEVKSTQSPSVPYLKQTISGSKALCDLMIEKFKKLRQFYAPDDGSESAEGLAGDTDAHLLKIPKTPVNARGGQRKESAKKSTPRGQKRNKTVDTDDDDDSSANNARTPRSTGSSATKQPAKRTKGGLSISPNESPIVTSTLSPKVKNSIEPKQFDICCLARWTDRKYYAGRVTNYREDNKYVVVFEDGCSKTLSRDIIVFGEDGVLPIQHHSIHALTGNDTYEPAIVEEIKRNELNEVVYFVRTAARTLTITATDIYLTDEQAKWIHNACKDKPNPIQQLLQSGSDAASTMDGGDRIAGTVGTVSEGTGSLTASDLGADNGNKGARSTRSTKLVTPEAGYSGGVGKKGRRGRRNQPPAPECNISECSDVSDTYEDETPVPVSPETGLDAVDGVQPELQRTEQESELTRMCIASEYFGSDVKFTLDQLLGPIPSGAKTLFRNKHFLLTCTIPPKGIASDSKNRQFSSVPFVKQHLRRQIEAGGGKVYQFFEDVPKNKYKNCKLIAPRPSTTAMYVQCLASNIVAVSHEWIIQCCEVLTVVDQKPFVLPVGWSFLEERYIEWSSGRGKDKRSYAKPFTMISINVASLCKDFNDFWSRVCKLAGATVRLIKTESDVTENLKGYLLTDQEFPEEIKIKAARNGLLVVSTVWVVQCLILGRICHPKSNEKLTQIYQEDDY